MTDDHPTDDPRELLTPFLERARWFGGKGRPFTVAAVTRLGEVPGSPSESLRVAVDVVRVDYGDQAGGSELYQLPLAFHEQPQEHLEHAHLGSWTDADFGPRHVYDAVHDRDAMGCWLRSFADPPEGPLRFERVPGHDLDLTVHSTLFSGEQSNSSVAFGEDSLMKVFRKLTPGANPDITVHDVLTRAGSDHVAALYGWLEAPASVAAGPDEEVPGEKGQGEEGTYHLAMLQQFLRTASDGWDLALASVRNLFAEGDLHADEVGGDFAGEAARLGTALAETHATLAEAFPTRDLGPAEVRALADDMDRRLTEALDVAPELAPHADRLRAVFDRVRGLDTIAVQQIHGDLHLGQTLRTVKGWKIVDFEGEPAKPLSERVRPDSRWRDVAGMLRSFDYAPRVVERSLGEHESEGAEQRAYRATEWAARNRSAFLAAYAAEGEADGRSADQDAGLDADSRALLEAYVADKAVYETVYETRNRPTWVAIPLEAIARIEAP